MDAVQSAQAEEMLHAREGSKYAKGELLAKLLKYELSNSAELREVLDHEIYHYLQTLHYPFLYYLCWLEFMNMDDIRKLIRKNIEISLPISGFNLPAAFLENFRFSALQVELFWKGEQLCINEIHDGSHSSQIFSLIDLIEDATTIFQYKISTDTPNHYGCYEWIMDIDRTCYRRFYRFIVKKFGAKKTYDLLPLLVQLAFSSTKPFGMLCHAIKLLNEMFIDYEQFPTKDIYYTIFNETKSAIGHFEGDIYEYGFIDNMPVKTFDHQNLTDLIVNDLENQSDVFFPMAIHGKKKLDQIKIDDDALFTLINIDKASFAKLIIDFEPMAIHFRFSNRIGRDSFLLLGRDYRNIKALKEVEYDNYLHEIIKLNGTTQRLLNESTSELLNNCHHTTCVYHSLGLCGSWTSIPREHQNCGFPYWFSWVFLRKINLRTMTLDKVTREVAEKDWDSYVERSFQSRVYQYTREDDKFTLTLSDEEFLNREQQNLFQNYIGYLKKTYASSDASLCGCITLVIHGYDQDNREVFDIPEIRNWLINTLYGFPDFLCYINFQSPILHHVFLRATFVKHEKWFGRDKTIKFKYDPYEFTLFSKQQSMIFYNFAYKHSVVDKKLLFHHLNRLINGN